MAAASIARAPISLPALGDPPLYLAEGVEGGEPELVSPPQTCQEIKFGGGQAPSGIGQPCCKGKGHWKNEVP